METDRKVEIFSLTKALDCCNSLYVALPQSAQSRLQLVENAAAGFLTGARKKDYVSLV